MHFLMLVTAPIEPGDTSHNVRSRIYSTLAEDSTFCGNGGLFGSPVCDWFVIGGRWSGWLTEILIGNPQERPEDDYGAEDDAMIVTRDLYNRILDRFSSHPIVHNSHVEFADMDGDPCHENFIGHKWLLVVDYHN